MPRKTCSDARLVKLIRWAVTGQSGFFGADGRLRALSVAGDPLERLTAVVDSSCSGRNWKLWLNRRTAAKANGRLTMRC
jgi:hypothetical protein